MYLSNHYVVHLKLIHCCMSIIVKKKKEWVLGKGWEIKGRRPTTLKEQKLGPRFPGEERHVVSPAQKHRDGSDMRWGPPISCF